MLHPRWKQDTAPEAGAARAARRRGLDTDALAFFIRPFACVAGALGSGAAGV